MRGWLFDVYPAAEGMVLWFLDEDSRPHRLTTGYRPAFYAAGPRAALDRLARRLRERDVPSDLTATVRQELFSGADLPVVRVAVHRPLQFPQAVRQAAALRDLVLYTCDLSVAQLFLYERGLFPLGEYDLVAEDGTLRKAVPCSHPEDLEYAVPPLVVMRLRLDGDPVNPNHGWRSELAVAVEGEEVVLSGERPEDLVRSLNRMLVRYDPDVLLTEWGDAFLLPRLLRLSQGAGVPLALNRDPRAGIAQRRDRSYVTYGKTVYTAGAHELAGRWHLDLRNSFIYTESEMAGLLEIARLARLPVQRLARTSTGTAISSMQLARAVQQHILVPWHKSEPEGFKTAAELLVTDKGGLTYQPLVGVYEGVGELDFSSMYPTIMARFNVSPETINCLVRARTPVATSQGWKPIAEVKPGDLVLTHQTRWRKVLRTFPVRYYKGSLVTFSIGGRTLTLTPEHQVLTAQGWKRVDQLRVGTLVTLAVVQGTDGSKKLKLSSVNGGIEVPFGHEGKGQNNLSVWTLDSKVRKKQFQDLARSSMANLIMPYASPVRFPWSHSVMHNPYTKSVSNPFQDGDISVRDDHPRVDKGGGSVADSSSPAAPYLLQRHHAFSIEESGNVGQVSGGKSHLQIYRRPITRFKRWITKKPVRLYNLEVAVDRSFCANGIVIHNCGCCEVDGESVPEIGHRICRRRRGLVPQVLDHLLERRVYYKRRKRETVGATRAVYDQRQSALKWCLVTSFGYLGYKNARYGRIEAHESTTAYSREMLLRAKEVAESQGFRMLHAIVDSMWLQKPGAGQAAYEALAREIEAVTKLPIFVEGVYNWIAFLPSRTHAGVGVPNRYMGVFADGSTKVRGIEVRRSDVPVLVEEMQARMLQEMFAAPTVDALRARLPAVLAVLEEALVRMREGSVRPSDLALTATISQEPHEYRNNHPIALAARMLAKSGIRLHPGEAIQYVVTDADAKVPEERVRPLTLLGPDWVYDQDRYAELLVRAAETVLELFGHPRARLWAEVWQPLRRASTERLRPLG